MQVVADTSVFIAVVMNEPEKAWVIASTLSGEAISPPSLPFEVANALSALVRRRILDRDQALAAWHAAKAIPVAVREIDVGAALQLASEKKIYAYDGFMLQCAREAAAPLLTLDRRLRSTARELGIDLVE